MNLRFAANSIRVRVTTEEFADLCKGKSMGLDVLMPRGHAFRLKLNPSSAAEWRFDSDPTGLWLGVPRTELIGLAQQLPSRQGITHGFATGHSELQISLEVDVKSGSKQA
ncbi:MAG: hypothetical protein AB7F79_04685 [Steroidobacteraceae bacterium]